MEVSPCVSTEYLPSIYRVSTLHQTICFHHIAPPHNPGPDSDSTQLLETILSPQSPTPGQCPQAEALLSEGMCPELINILGNAIVKYLQYVVKHRAFWQKQFKTRLGLGMAKIWKNWAKKCQLRSWWYLRGSKFIKVADTPVTTSRPAGMLKQFDRGSPGSGLVFVSDSNQRANLSTPTCTQ